MKKFFKVLKINFLSILALPLLLLATASKLIARAFDKAVIILKMLLVMSMIVMAFELLKNPGDILQAIAYLIAAIILGGLILAIVFWVIGIISAFLAVIWNIIIGFFEGIYNLCFGGYLKLSEICETDYQIISLKGNKIGNAFLCLFYSLLKGISKLISGIVSLSFVLSILLSVGMVIGSLIYTNQQVREAFGLNLFQYLGKFDLYSVIYGGVLYLAFLAATITILVSLGLEWYEWAKELRMTSEEYADYIKQLQQNQICMEEKATADAAANDTASVYMNSLEEQIRTIEILGNSVDEVQSQKENTMLRSYWGEYLRELKELTDSCSSYKKGIPYDEFQKMIPRIQGLEKQKREIEQLVAKLKEEYRNPLSSSVYFGGCDTPEKLEQRYKSLCKTYHPDTGSGDEETFKRMMDEYEQLKQAMNTEV